LTPDWKLQSPVDAVSRLGHCTHLIPYKDHFPADPESG
jgi:hypothetical protein